MKAMIDLEIKPDDSGNMVAIIIYDSQAKNIHQHLIDYIKMVKREYSNTRIVVQRRLYT